MMTAKSEIVNILSLARVFITVEKRMVGSTDLANGKRTVLKIGKSFS